MAFFTDTHHRDAGLMERATTALSHWLSGVADTLARRRMARTTFTELSSLGDRDLRDLGLTRADLRRVARDAAEGKL